MKSLRVNTIYPAFMGEVNTHGIGVPCVFVRLAGCNLRCYLETKGTLCDTPEALEMKSGKDMSVSEIVDTVKRLGRKIVCLTGGEPLMQDVKELLTELSNNGYFVVVETNGSKSIAPYRHIRNVSFVVDVKSASSGESERMLEENYALLDEKDFLKFVVDTKEDVTEFERWMFVHDYINCNVAVGTFWGSEVTYGELIKELIRFYNVAWQVPVHLNMQAHKMACLYDDNKDKWEFRDLFIPRDL